MQHGEVTGNDRVLAQGTEVNPTKTTVLRNGVKINPLLTQALVESGGAYRPFYGSRLVQYSVAQCSIV